LEEGTCGYTYVYSGDGNRTALRALRSAGKAWIIPLMRPVFFIHPPPRNQYCNRIETLASKLPFLASCILPTHWQSATDGLRSITRSRQMKQ
jgi:hypothetical protein